MSPAAPAPFFFLFAFLALPLCSAEPPPPVVWDAPASFDLDGAGHGLAQLPGVRAETLFEALPSNAAVEDGGDGRYESIRHGTYSHGARAVVLGDKIIVYWGHHARDENGSGARILARWGTLSPDRSSVDWGSVETNLVEVAPQPVPVRRREPIAASKERRYIEGGFRVVDGRLVLEARVSLFHGASNDAKYFSPSGPIPDENFRDTWRDGVGFHTEMRWITPVRIYQEWKFAGGRLVPASPLFLNRRPPATLQLTPTRALQLGPLLPPYDKAPLLESLPDAGRGLFLRPGGDGIPPVSAASRSHPYYPKDSAHIAANGKNRLAHMAFFRRPDGSWVSIRDNLADPLWYYAAETSGSVPFPPAVKTNLYGIAMPAAGELPDGSCWILGNSERRHDYYLALSRDGRRFDRAWSLFHDSQNRVRGYAKGPGDEGPSYPHAFVLGDALWIVSSVGKTNVAAIRAPLASLRREMEARVVVPASRHDWRAVSGRTLAITPAPGGTRPPGAPDAAALRFTAAAGDQAAALLRFPDTTLAATGDTLRLHLQFILAGAPPAFPDFGDTADALRRALQFDRSPSKQAPENFFHLTLANGAAGPGCVFLFQPVSPQTDGHPLAGLTLLPASSAAIASRQAAALPVPFAPNLKYDLQLTLERTPAGLAARARLFGANLPDPVELAATVTAGTPATLNTLALFINAATRLTLSHCELTRLPE
ncbi:MAG: hypothetical protein LBM92_00405 [Opitutaceae bacterium]|jgi:hypothetical protein|nr:hypothetical protein [Opitutaceae bacterium]